MCRTPEAAFPGNAPKLNFGLTQNEGKRPSRSMGRDPWRKVAPRLPIFPLTCGSGVRVNHSCFVVMCWFH